MQEMPRSFEIVRLGVFPDRELGVRPVDSAVRPCDDAHVSTNRVSADRVSPRGNRPRRPRLPGADRQPARPVHDAGARLGDRRRRGGRSSWPASSPGHGAPATGSGPLMVAACFALLRAQLRYSHDPLVFTVFFALGELGVRARRARRARVSVRSRHGPLERLWLVKVAYPSRSSSRSRSSCSTTGACALKYFTDPAREPAARLGRRRARQGAPEGVRDRRLRPPRDALHRADRAAARARDAEGAAAARAAARRRRRRRALRAVLDCVLTFVDRPLAYVYLFWWQIIALTRSRSRSSGDSCARGSRGCTSASSSSTSSRRRSTGSGRARADALDDPTLELGLWLPERGAYVDAGGASLAVPDDGPRRAVTWIEHDGEPLAVLVHDPSLRDEPKLVEAVAAAARLALVNARLHAEVSAQLATVQESRARIVTAAGRGAAAHRARPPRRRAAAARRARARAPERAAALGDEAEPGARPAARVDRGRAPGRRRGAARARARHPPGDAHAGGPRLRARGARRADAAAGRRSTRRRSGSRPRSRRRRTSSPARRSRTSSSTRTRRRRRSARRARTARS